MPSLLVAVLSVTVYLVSRASRGATACVTTRSRKSRSSIATTGSLVVAMLRHAVWDFGLLGTRGTGRGLRPAQAAAVVAVYLTGIVAVWFVATS